MTFIENGRPAPRDKDEILTDLIASAEDAFGREFSPNEKSVIRSFYDPVAEYAAGQQEDLAAAVDASQIDYAEDDALGLLAALIGVSRRAAQPASTELQFQHDGPVTRDYTIPQGTQAQTDNADPVVFETDEATTLELYDDFEDQDLSKYTGDTADFSIQSTTVSEGTYALEAPASGATIVNTGPEITEGARMHYHNYVQTGGKSEFLFAATNTDNYYSVFIDEPGGKIGVKVSEGGGITELNSVSVTVPTDEFLDVQVDWNYDTSFDVIVENSAENEVTSFSASESNATHTEGGFGFHSNDTTSTKYFDFVTSSRTSVEATATEAAARTNVGARVVTIMADTVSGVDTVTNPLAATGGRDREPDDDLRERAKRELSTGMRATLPALINRVRAVDDVRAVTVIDNDTNSTDADNRPPHSFEAIVDAPTNIYEDIAEIILDTKAVGDTAVGGHAGVEITETLELVNGQTKDISFSEPSPVKIYVDADIEVTDVYAGDSQVRDNIVRYIGGELTTGDNIGGELEFRDDVIYNQVLEAVMDVTGVHDVTSLTIGKTDSPTGTSNITIGDTELATTTADTATLGVTTTEI